MWIEPIKPNMDISCAILEKAPSSQLEAILQKIAICTVAPFFMIALTEAVIKNLIGINLLNLGITLLNIGHAKCWPQPAKK